MAWNPKQSFKEAAESKGSSSSEISKGIQAGDWGRTGTGAANFLSNGAYGQGSRAVGAAGDTLETKGGQVADAAKSAWEHLQDMYNNARNGLGAPVAPGGAGGVNQVHAPTYPGAGGGYGGSPIQIGGGAAAYNPATDPFRQGQTKLLSQLQAQAAGTGPSIAQNQLKLGQESALANNIAMANSARGGANPLMARQALQQNAQQSGAMANEAANLRLQEQMQAQQALGGLTAQGRQGDFSQQQLAQTGQIAQGQLQQQGAELAAKYAAMGMSAEQANQQAQIDLMKLQQEGGLGYANLGFQSQVAQNALLGNALQGGAGALAGLGTLFSDKRLKKDVKKADKEITAFLSNLNASSYSYKDEKHGKGRFVSPMAQELLKSDIGRSMVEQKPEGLAVNYGRGLGAILAAQATLHKRLEKLEKK